VKRTWLVFLAAVFATGPALASEGEDAGLFYPFVNLALLLAVLIYFARQPIREFFQDRRAQIQNDIHSAEELRRETEERHAKWNRRILELESDLEEIRVDGRRRAEAERDRILAEARALAERIRSDATAAIDQELQRSREILREEAADLAVELARRLVRETVDDADRARLVDEFIERIEADAQSGAAGTRA
jgi:F-type H+-transporting ATPase subunit b